VKGCGEAGCAGSLTSIMNAVVDALSEYGIRHIDMPATPYRVWKAIHDAQRRAGVRCYTTRSCCMLRSSHTLPVMAGLVPATRLGTHKS